MKKIKYLVLLVIMIFSFGCNDIMDYKEELEFRLNDGVLEWKYVNDDEWKLACDLSDIDKEQSNDIEIRVNDCYLEWNLNDNEWIRLFDLSTLKGKDGENPEFEVVDNKLMLEYPNKDKEVLFDFNAIKPSDGKDVILQMNGKMLEWKYSDSEEWIKLYDFSVLEKEMVLEITKKKRKKMKMRG